MSLYIKSAEGLLHYNSINNIHNFVLIYKRVVHSSLGWRVAKECFKELSLAEGHNTYNNVVIHDIGRRPFKIY